MRGIQHGSECHRAGTYHGVIRVLVFNSSVTLQLSDAVVMLTVIRFEGG